MVENDIWQKPQTLDKGADHRTLLQIVISQFFEHRMAVVGLCTVLFFLLVALSAPLLAMFLGQTPEAQNVFHRYQPPLSRIELPLDDRVVAIETWAQQEPQLAQVFHTSLKTAGLSDRKSVV